MTFEASSRRSSETPTEFACGQCDFVGEDNNKLASHKKDSHGNNLQCDKFKHIATSVNALRNHVKEKHERVFSCDKCEYKDTNLVTLQGHKKAEHENHPCDFCDLIADSQDILEIHELEFHNLKSIMLYDV